MPRIEWDDSISVLIPEIDEQHKKLIGWINQLDEAINSVTETRVINKLFNNLLNYVLEHFSAEENFMKSFNFEGYEEHIAEHESFVDRLVEIRTSFELGDALSTDILSFLTGWLLSHIKVTDQKYSVVIRKIMEERKR